MIARGKPQRKLAHCPLSSCGPAPSRTEVKTTCSARPKVRAVLTAKKLRTGADWRQALLRA